MPIYLKLIFPIILITHLTVSFAATNTHLVNMNFSNIPVQHLLKTIAELSAKNIIISPKITGNISIHLKNVTWQEALQVILATSNLTTREEANIIYILPITESTNLENVQTKGKSILHLHYAKAKEVASLIKNSGLLSASGSSAPDIRTNSLLIEDVSSKLNAVTQYVQTIDIPAPQVLIAARIVSVDANFARELGIKFGTLNVTANNNGTHDVTMDLSSTAPGYGRFDLTIAKLKDGQLLDMELSALESEGRGKVISSPKLITGNRVTAYIESGSEIPYQEKAAHGATNVAFKKAVLSLKVTPEIVAADKLNLVLQLNQDKVSQLTVNGVPAIDTRRIQTQVTVKDGETVILGGIYEWANSESLTYTPILGKIPVLGMLFTHKEIKKERKELLMFVTPKIME